MLQHTKISHSHIYNVRIVCFFPGCQATFARGIYLENHVKAKHMPNNTANRQTNRQIKCDICNLVISNLDNLRKHYPQHVEESFLNSLSTPIYCYFYDKSCHYACQEFTARSKVNFQNHLYTCHNDSIELNGSDFLNNNFCSICLISIYKIVDRMYQTSDPTSDPEEYMEIVENEQNFDREDLNRSLIQDSRFEMENYYMRFYHKLKDGYLIPKYQVDEIFESINDIVSFNNKCLLDNINKWQSEFTS